MILIPTARASLDAAAWWIVRLPKPARDAQINRPSLRHGADILVVSTSDGTGSPAYNTSAACCKLLCYLGIC